MEWRPPLPEVMLDIPSRTSAGPEPAADPYAWVDPGERWVKEPRNLAPALDSFLTHAHKLGAEQVMFATFQPASFRLWGVNRKVKTRDPLDENDASLIVNHLYGADGVARLQGGADINVMYQIGSPRKGTLRFRCNVTAITASRGAGAHVVIRPVRDLPQPLSSQNVEPEILAHYRMTKGMMIVSGATGSGKSTLIGAMTVEKLRDPDAHRNIIECAEPVEFLLDRVESPTSSISQSEIPRNVKSFEEFMAGAMRRQPTDIIIGECRKPEHMIATIQAAISGHATATTIHAETVPLTMQRVASLLPPAQLKDAMTSCAQALRLVINQRLVPSTNGKWTPLREFLICDAAYRKRLASTRADDWPQITAEALETTGQSYAKAIGIALEQGRISEQTADDVRHEIG
jgi:defect in organelle trafficking protein DotB